MKILLTGGAGYIGSHVLVCCLQAGHDVCVLDNFSNSSPEAITRVEALCERKVHVERGDIRDIALLRRILSEGGFDAVLHFAGVKAVGESVAKPLKYYDINVAGSITLAQAMQEAGVYRLVFSSTAAVYGDQSAMPLTETSALGQAASPYGRSKRMVEQVFEDLQMSDPRFGIAILRYFNPVGAHPSGRIGEDPRGEPANLVPYAMQVAVGQREVLSVFGDDYPTSDGTGVRDYIHIMDLAQGHLAALDYLVSTSEYRVWNLGTGRGHSVKEVINCLNEVTGKVLPLRIVERRPGDTAQCWADPSKAVADLDWHATRGLHDMLADHWRWQQQNPDGYGKR
ncbi:UDP-glucose 4-epimerase GalE [Pseudorhodobacter ferrugineus]|uniref:UDP-glucose 4-epimerase GalE n=1 Tax=Pseudorhodobacter ferrugineus TaxID=77008 RepID=UPI0003B52C3E|nr:UDP-glucose 4-epimerase GalE [Pseudorhodobacter ferrugineus]